MSPRGRSRRSAPPVGTVGPGEHLRAEMERLGLNQVSMGKRLGVTRQTVNNVINGRQPISRALSAALGQLTDRPADYWLQSSFGRSAVTQPHYALLAKEQILHAIEGGLIAVSPFVKQQVRAASIELTLGGVAAAESTKPHAASLRLGAGRSAFVLTHEVVQLSAHHVGRLGVTATMAAKGLAAFAPLQVEPGFGGQICLAVFNASGHDILLRPGEPVFALEVVALAP